MAEVKVCPVCSKFNREDFQKELEAKGHKVKFGCIVYCRDKEETKFPYFGLIDGKLHEYEKYEGFMEALKEEN